jgi:predicted nucleotidyltransferase
LNREHRLVQDGILPLLEVEAGFPRAVRDALAGGLQRSVLSLILFGSVARNEESARSDLDLCLIVPTSAAKEKALEDVHAFAPAILRQYGVRISPIAFSLREFRLAARRHQSPVREIAVEGRVLVGRQLRGLLSGKREHKKSG